MSFVRYAAMAAGGLLFSGAAAFAGPIYTFSVSDGVQPSNVGVITLTQVDSNTVKVLVDLIDTSLPDPQYGFINTGPAGDGNGPKTPFAFTLNSPEAGTTATFIQPAGGTYAFGMFDLSTLDGQAVPFGTYGISINSTAGNGSANAYFGDLEFTVTRAGGLSTDDFITNAAIGPGSNGPAYFAADLTNGKSSGNTGSQEWRARDGTPVPEPASLVLFGTALVGLGLIGRSRNRRNLT